MFLENFLANLISGITLKFFKFKKQNNKSKPELEQGNNKQKNNNSQNIVQNIGTQNINIYLTDPKDITPIDAPRDDSNPNVSGTVNKIIIKE